VYFRGESNPSIGADVAKATGPQPTTWTMSTLARAAVFKGGESRGYDPKPSDLCVGRVKRGESHVEAR